MKGLISNVSNQHPDFFRQMVKSPNEARRSARQLGLHPPIGSTYQEIGIVNVPERLHEAVKTFAKKLTKAVYWRETSTIFPLNGQMMFNWFTNATVLQLGSIPIFDAMASFMGTPQTVARTGKDLSGQFAYKYAVRPKGELAVLQAYFGKSFGFVSIVSSAPNVLAKIVENAKEKSGRDDLPFEFL